MGRLDKPEDGLRFLAGQFQVHRSVIPSDGRVDESGADGSHYVLETEAAIVPLYAARLCDLGPADFVQLECACGHVMLVVPDMLLRAGAAPDRKVVDLQPRLRCRECDARGKALVSIRWGKEGTV